MIRILIDPVACDAYGYCAELLPEAITLDEWGYPIVDGTPSASRDRPDAAKRAARDCPRRAITLRGAQRAVTEAHSRPPEAQWPRCGGAAMIPHGLVLPPG